MGQYRNFNFDTIFTKYRDIDILRIPVSKRHLCWPGSSNPPV